MLNLCMSEILPTLADSVKSALDSDLLEGTSSGLWLVQSMSGGRMAAEAKEPSASRDSTSSSSSDEMAEVKTGIHNERNKIEKLHC